MSDSTDAPLSGSEAVDRAAERAKSTAHRNIPPLSFEGFPLPEDTANLREGPSLHDGLLALLPLVGVWAGTGQADDHGEQYAFGQQLVVSHDGENYLRFESRLWRLGPDGEAAGPDQREVGFWRISPRDEIEVTLTNSRGLVEILYGEPVNERAWQVTSASTIVTATGPAEHGPGKRLYGLMPNNNLGWVDERAVDGELVPYMSAELTRIAG
ncbi:FABP family protein [Corynebacterium liangguodongii]|uniref:Ferric nitrobindin-like protein n=1 Tax=Corynebacterium liangguodongii TaxID=2079535 RepID=A0A2S0WFS0_9CORY|nr:FABP family protein [Corynebacterium liangguodongii]AWB84611.1 FABP family protein [Corynebacterium liangguodongii]PWB99619.1 FABP family protein [Corynebacterium liangguodongii]